MRTLHEPELHTTTFDGDQIVEVGRYAYQWQGKPPLEVGELVLLPENWASPMIHGPGPWVGEVTKLGSAYSGRLARVIDRAPADAREESA